jgi:hypothetical protein
MEKTKSKERRKEFHATDYEKDSKMEKGCLEGSMWKNDYQNEKISLKYNLAG